MDSSAAIDTGGTIYVGSYDGHLYALNPDGTLKWKFDTGNAVGSSPAIGSTGSTGIALFNQGNDKVIYVCSGDALFAVYPDGTVKWVFSIDSPFGFLDCSPTIAFGSVIFACSGGLVYAVDSQGTTLVPSDWPKIFHDLKNTSRAEVALPTLTLSGGGVQGGCPDEVQGQEVIILSFSLSADWLDSWEVGSFRFESWGSGNEYEHIEDVDLYVVGESFRYLLAGSIYLEDDGIITLIPEQILKIPHEETVNLELVYKFKKRAWIRCPFDQDFRVRTRPGWIYARPSRSEHGLKRGPEIEGIIAFGCVKNTTTNKVFSEIQEAIDDEETKDGHTIIVCPGTYVENVVVIKNGLTIRSRDGRDVTTVQCQTSGDWPFASVFTIIGNNTTIDGFTIKGSAYKYGIAISQSEGNKIINNTITDNSYGVYLENCEAGTPNVIRNNDIPGHRLQLQGITIRSSFGTKIIDNTIASNFYNGIFFSGCEAPKNSPNIVENNDIKEHADSGIYVDFSFGTNIINNTIASNTYGITFSGCEAPKNSPNIVKYNDIVRNDVHGVLFFLSSFGTNIINNTIASNGQYGIRFSRCKAPKDLPNIVEDNKITRNDDAGVNLAYSFGTNIINNRIALNGNGVYFEYCEAPKDSPNFITRNTIYENSKSGILSKESSNNLIFNNFIWFNCTGIESHQSCNEMWSNSIQNSECSQTGIHLDGSSSEIIGNTISDDAGDGIRCENGANPVIRKNNITNNTGFGLNNIDILVNIDAQENWWGDASGPAGAGPGTGDEVSENVDFSNWRSEPVALVVTSGWDVYGAKGTEVTATFYVANLSDSNDTYDINVSDTLGWPLGPITLTETIIAGQSNQILINVSIPLDALNGTEDEIILTATSASNPTATDSATLKVTVGEIWMIIDDFSVGAPPLTVINHDGVFPLKDGTTVQSPMVLGGEFDAVINLVSAELGDGTSAEIRGGSLHYTQDASCTAVLVFHYDGNDGSWEQVHASTGLGGGIDITNGGTYDRIRVKFLNNVSPFVMAVILFTDQDNSSEAKITVPASADPFTVEYLFEGLVHQGNGADLTNVRTILFLAGSGGGMTGLMDFEIDGIWAIPVDETPPSPVAALSNSWGFRTSYLLPRWWP